jgi:ABC-type lipoprotein release transport system permease subunit
VDEAGEMAVHHPAFTDIMVAAFNIVSSQIMIVLEKRREIGILKAMGASRREISRIFLYEGLIIGVVALLWDCWSDMPSVGDN